MSDRKWFEPSSYISLYLITSHIILPITSHNTDHSIASFDWTFNGHLTLKMTFTQDDEMLVTMYSRSKDFFHPHNQIPLR